MPFKTQEEHGNGGALLRDIVLGGQDGLVNVLGLILGIVAATQDSRLVLISGLAAACAEAVAMAGSAYSSARAEKDYYFSQLEKEKKEIKEVPEIEKEEIRLIYMKKGFKGKDLEKVVETITSNEEVWLKTMMTEELNLGESESIDPVQVSLVVGSSALIAALIPLIPFLLFPIPVAAPLTFVLSVFILFVSGAYKAKITVGDWKKSGIEMVLVGSCAAVAGYLIGHFLGAKV